MVADLISGSISQLNTPGKTVFRQLLVSIPKEMTGGYLYCQVMRTSLPSFDINRYSRLDIAFLNLVLPPSSLFFPSVSFVCCFSSHLISSSLCIYLVCSTLFVAPIYSFPQCSLILILLKLHLSRFCLFHLSLLVHKAPGSSSLLQ